MKKTILAIVMMMIGTSLIWGESSTGTVDNEESIFFQEAKNNFVQSFFSPQEKMFHLEVYGFSPYLEAEVTFLNLTPQQKDKYIQYLRKMADISSALRGIMYEYNRTTNEDEQKKILEKEKMLEQQWNKVPDELSEIFGKEKIRKYLEFIGFTFGSPQIKNNYFNMHNKKIGGILSLSNKQNQELNQTVINNYQDYRNLQEEIGSAFRKFYNHFGDDERKKIILSTKENISYYKMKEKQKRGEISRLLKTNKKKKIFEENLGWSLED